MKSISTSQLSFGLLACVFAGCAHESAPAPEAPETPAASADLATDALAHRRGSIVVRATPGAVVQVRQTRHDFWFGAAIANSAFDGGLTPEDTARYRAAFLENFNAAVTENALKWQVMQPRREAIDYSVVDAILSWTETHEIPLRGHNIFWGIPKFVQPWVKALDDEALETTLRARAIDIATRYRGRFAHYDLNNEMIHGNYYAQRLGDGITLKMATWVKAHDPDAKLFVNDYDILTGNRLEQYVEHIRTLLDAGVPLSGIGVQGHLHGDSFDPAALGAALDRLATFGLPVVVTEFNFPGQRSKFYREKGRHVMSSGEEAAKARAIARYYRICFSHPAVDGILMWGFWAGANWIPESSLFREDWTPTPALAAYRQLVFGEWWTSAKVQVGESGEVTVPAFYGRHEVTAGGQTRTVHLRKDDGAVVVDLR